MDLIIADTEALLERVCATTIKKIELASQSYEYDFETATERPHVVLAALIKAHPSVLGGSTSLERIVKEIDTLVNITPQYKKAARLLQTPLKKAFEKYISILGASDVYDSYFANAERGNPGFSDQLIRSITLSNAFTHPMVKRIFSRNTQFDEDLAILRDVIPTLSNRAVFHQPTTAERKSKKRKISDVDVYSPAWKDSIEYTQMTASKLHVRALCSFVKAMTTHADSLSSSVASQEESKRTLDVLSRQLAVFLEQLRVPTICVAADENTSAAKAKSYITRWLTDFIDFVEEDPSEKELKAFRSQQKEKLKRKWLEVAESSNASKREEWTNWVSTLQPQLCLAAEAVSAPRKIESVARELAEVGNTLKRLESSTELASVVAHAITLAKQPAAQSQSIDEFDKLAQQLADKAAIVDFIVFAFSLLDLKEFDDNDRLLRTLKDKKSNSVPQASPSSSVFKACVFVANLCNTAHTEGSRVTNDKLVDVYAAVDRVREQMQSVVSKADEESRAAAHAVNAAFLDDLRRKSETASACATSVANIVTVDTTAFEQELQEIIARLNKHIYFIAKNTGMAALEAAAAHRRALASHRASSQTPGGARFSEYASIFIHLITSCVALSRA
jgi:hypothetical protein